MGRSTGRLGRIGERYHRVVMATVQGPNVRRRLYGLTLSTTVPVGEPATRAEHLSGSADWTIEWVDPPSVPGAAPPGTPVVTEGVWPAMRHEQMVTLWHEELGRVGIDVTARRITLGLTVRTEEVAALLLRGIVLALALELTGVPTLHANGVIIGDRAVAVAGPRGVGKTTVTAALVAAGIELLSDDVVAIDREPQGWFARSGLTQLRLRGGAAHLAELIGDRYPQQPSVDGRHVVVLPPPACDRLPLRAIVVPRIDEQASGPQLAVVSASEAFSRVAASFRIATFVEPTPLVARMGVTADIATSVPVLTLSMPLQHRWTRADAVELRQAFETLDAVLEFA